MALYENTTYVIPVGPNTAGASDELLARVMRRETFVLSGRTIRQSHSYVRFVKMAEMRGKVIFGGFF